MKLWLLVVVVACLVSFWAGYATRKPPSQPDLQTVSNRDYLNALGLADSVEAGCGFWLGDTTTTKMVIFFGRGTDVRVTAVCVPLVNEH